MSCHSSIIGVARESCFSIIKHYSDPIHLMSSDVERDESAPYFDPVLGQPCLPSLPPFCQVWYQRLLGWNKSDTTLSESNGSIGSSAVKALDVTRGLVYCYESSIHLSVRQLRMEQDQDNDVHAVDTVHSRNERLPFSATLKILQYYELMISHLMEKVAADEGRDSDIWVRRDYDGDRTEYCPTIVDCNDSEINQVLKIGETMHYITDDICHWASKLSDDDEDILPKIRNLLLPYLLRLLSHCVALLGIASAQELSSDTVLRKEALAIATVVSVPFVGDGRLSSGAFSIGSLLEWILSRNNIIGESRTVEDPLSLSLTIKQCPLVTCDELLMTSDFITRPVVDWSVPAAQFKAPWSDGISGIGHRLGVRLLNMVRHSLRAPAIGEDVVGTGRKVSSLLCEISHVVGIDILASTTRAFFYGRLVFPLSPSNDNSITSPEPKGPFVPIIKRVRSVQDKGRNGSPSANVDHHVKNKICLSSAAILLSAIFDGYSEIALRDKACLDTVPLVLSLLDDTTPFNQGVGALIFIAVMSSESGSLPRALDTFHVTLTRSIRNAVQLCGREDATLLAVLCLAQSKWFEVLSRHWLRRTKGPTRMTADAISADGLCILIREALVNLFDVVRKQSHAGHYDGSDIRTGAAFVTGINPLLNLLAAIPQAASIEIGRAGLSTILPLVGSPGMSLESRSIQISALCALLSLMKSAHPIMSNHGTKLMFDVFVLLHRLDNDAKFLNETMSTQVAQSHAEISIAATRQLGMYAAAVALVVGGRGAEDVLNHIELQNRSDALIHRCREIRNLSSQLTNAS